MEVLISRTRVNCPQHLNPLAFWGLGPISTRLKKSQSQEETQVVFVSLLWKGLCEHSQGSGLNPHKLLLSQMMGRLTGWASVRAPSRNKTSVVASPPVLGV